MPRPAMPADVAAVFDRYPQGLRDRLGDLRALIHDEAGADPRIGPLSETLKWGEPAYLPQAPRIGTTLRLGPRHKGAQTGALFVNCNTTLVEDLCALCGDELAFDGRRAVLIPPAGPLPEAALRLAIRMGLTYHLRKRAGLRSAGAHRP